MLDELNLNCVCGKETLSVERYGDHIFVEAKTIPGDTKYGVLNRIEMALRILTGKDPYCRTIIATPADFDYFIGECDRRLFSEKIRSSK